MPPVHGTIDGFVVDVFLSEDHGFDSEVTEFPVERGADVTDHVRARPVQVVVEGLVSDTPFGAVADERPVESLPSADAYSKMIAIRDAREPVTIETSLGTFEDMALVNLSVPRDTDTGDALRFRATFRQVELVTNERTVVKVEVPRAAKKRNLGNKKAEAPPEVPETPEQDRSILEKLTGKSGRATIFGVGL